MWLEFDFFSSAVVHIARSLGAGTDLTSVSRRVIFYGYSLTQQQPQYRATQRACAQHYPTSVDPSHLLCFFAIKATRKPARKTPPEPPGVKVIKYNIRICAQHVPIGVCVQFTGCILVFLGGNTAECGYLELLCQCGADERRFATM